MLDQRPSWSRATRYTAESCFGNHNADTRAKLWPGVSARHPGVVEAGVLVIRITLAATDEVAAFTFINNVLYGRPAGDRRSELRGRGPPIY